VAEELALAGIKCTKCGAPIDIDPGQRIAKCKYCDSQIFIDKSGAGFFYIIPFMLNASQAQSTFKRWSAGSKMARDLEAQAHISILRQSYFPVYMFKRDVGGREQVLVQPARSTTLPGMRNLKIPPGDLKVFDQKYSVEGAEVISPDMDMMAYLGTLPGKPLEQALVYFPTWVIEYGYKGRKYSAVIDGSSGEIFAADSPPRQSAPYVIIGAVSFVLFLVEGLFFPWGLIAAVPTAIAIFGAGYYVAKNM
jgi:hypothetical protein